MLEQDEVSVYGISVSKSLFGLAIYEMIRNNLGTMTGSSSQASYPNAVWLIDCSKSYQRTNHVWLRKFK